MALDVIAGARTSPLKLLLGAILLCCTSVALVTSRDQSARELNTPRSSKYRNSWQRHQQPNIVFVITDDQDSELGESFKAPFCFTCTCSLKRNVDVRRLFFIF